MGYNLTMILCIVLFTLCLGLFSSAFGQPSDLNSVLEKAQKSVESQKQEKAASVPLPETVTDIQPNSSQATKIESTGTKQNLYNNEACAVSIVLPKGWKAVASQFVFEDKSKTLADFQSPDDDILTLSLAIENMGLAQRSSQDISRLERESVTLGDTTVLSTDTGVINGFPSYKTVYSQGSAGKYELQKDKFHNMDILITAFDREYRLTYEAADKVEFDKYQSIIEDMAQTIKISEPKFEGINCQTAGG